MSRRSPRWRGPVLVALLAALGLLPPALLRAQDDESLRAAKALFFDRKYAEARQAWRAIQASGRGPEAAAAAYWVARCSEHLGELPRALSEYGDYLAKRPGDRALAEEARTSRVGLAARLYKAGAKEHLPILTDALRDPSRTVRYFAALQLSSLGREVGRPAIPILRKIVAEEPDEDLTERAKLALLRLAPETLAESTAPALPPAGRRGVRTAGFIRVRIYEGRQAKPKVSINLPVALAELVFKSLPDEARLELKRRGYDADNFWDHLKRLEPAEILTIEGGGGERIQVWIE
jgi:hypothetical protein